MYLLSTADSCMNASLSFFVCLVKTNFDHIWILTMLQMKYIYISNIYNLGDPNQHRDMGNKTSMSNHI